jgi:hypothetical protein
VSPEPVWKFRENFAGMFFELRTVQHVASRQLLHYSDFSRESVGRQILTASNFRTVDWENSCNQEMEPVVSTGRLNVAITLNVVTS